MLRTLMTLIFAMIAGTAFASIVIQGNMQIKLKVGTSSSSGGGGGEPGEDIGALLKEDTGIILKEDGGVLLYD